MEPRFFAFEGNDLDFHGPGDHLLKERIVTEWENYLQLYGGVTGEIAIGEVSPAYLSSPSAPACIHHYIPDAKIVAILRNPVDRAISSFRLEVLEGFEPCRSLMTALELEEARMRDGWSYVWRYKERGLYYRHLKRYFDIFPRDQIKVFLYEDWRPDGVGLLKSVFRFLCVDETLGMSARAVRHNTTAASRFDARGVAEPVCAPDVRAQLVEHYRDEIDRLQSLIGRDLSEWLVEKC
jgi:hypothetical protein